jgi:glutamate--cysteine ligase
MRFLDVFLLHCLLADSPPDTPAEIAQNGRNKQSVAASGRTPGLELERGSGRVALRAWAGEILAACAPVAAALDAACGGEAYGESLAEARASVERPETLPSARVLEAMRRDHRASHNAFVLAQSRAHRATFVRDPLAPEAAARQRQLAEESIAAQRRVEAADAVPFETFRQHYLSPERLQPR